MKKIISALLPVILLAACQSPQKEVPPTEEDHKKSSAQADSIAPIDYQEINSDEALVATALMAAPAESRAGCKVIGYNMAGEFVTLKEGSNQFICLADNPNEEGFRAACYHKSLEPFMARGRELRAAGKSGQAVFDMREEEVKSGKLTMGKPGSTLHVYAAPEAIYDPTTGAVADASYRYVVYMPFATAESTGLPKNPIAPNHPWIMNPGTHRAHIMITPKRN